MRPEVGQLDALDRRIETVIDRTRRHLNRVERIRRVGIGGCAAGAVLLFSAVVTRFVDSAVGDLAILVAGVLALGGLLAAFGARVTREDAAHVLDHRLEAKSSFTAWCELESAPEARRVAAMVAAACLDGGASPKRAASTGEGRAPRVRVEPSSWAVPVILLLAAGAVGLLPQRKAVPESLDANARATSTDTAPDIDSRKASDEARATSSSEEARPETPAIDAVDPRSTDSRTREDSGSERDAGEVAAPPRTPSSTDASQGATSEPRDAGGSAGAAGSRRGALDRTALRELRDPNPDTRRRALDAMQGDRRAEGAPSALDDLFPARFRSVVARYFDPES